VLRYRDLGARRAVAELSTTDRHSWFVDHLPGRLRLASPGVRDAMMHALQCCVPDAVLLPMGMDLIVPAADYGPGPVIVHAAEVDHVGTEYVYDVVARGIDGAVLELWRGLRLKAVRPSTDLVLPAPLLASAVQRAVEQRTGVPLTVGIEIDTDRAQGSRRAASRALGRDVVLRHRADGRPEAVDAVAPLATVAGGVAVPVPVSVSHAGPLVLAVAGSPAVSCDAELVRERSADTWRAMLGEGLSALATRVQAVTGRPEAASTLVWSALECLRKLGRHDAMLTVGPVAEGGWLEFAAGSHRVLGTVVSVHGMTDPLVVAVAVPVREGVG
jgi:enediyne polyketide synthase